AEQAFYMLAKGGTATVIGMIPVGTKIELHGPDFLQEKKIQGSSMGSNRFRVDMPRYVDMYLNGKLKLDEMITREITLEQINEAFTALLGGEVARLVICFVEYRTRQLAQSCTARPRLVLPRASIPIM